LNRFHYAIVTGFLLSVLAGTVRETLVSADSGVVGSNGVRPGAFVGEIGQGSELCQGLGSGSRRPEAVQMVVGANGTSPRLRLRIRGVRAVTVLSAYHDGVVTGQLPIGTPQTTATLCIANEGNHLVALAGERLPAAVVNGAARPYAVSFTLIAKRRPWSRQATAIVARVGFGRGDAGAPATGWIMLSLFATAFVGALAGVWRSIE
jgi:hypothetical protein